MRTLRFLMKHGEPPGAELPGERELATVEQIGGRKMIKLTGSIAFPYIEKHLETIKDATRTELITVGQNGHSKIVGIADNVISFPSAPRSLPEGTPIHLFPTVWAPLEHEEELRGKFGDFLDRMAKEIPDAASNGLIADRNQAILALQR